MCRVESNHLHWLIAVSYTHLVADDDKAKFNWAATEYSERLLSHCPAQFTAVQEMI